MKGFAITYTPSRAAKARTSIASCSTATSSSFANDEKSGMWGSALRGGGERTIRVRTGSGSIRVTERCGE